MSPDPIAIPHYRDFIGESNEDFSKLFFDEHEFEQRRGLEEKHYWHRVRRRILLDALRRVCPDPTTPLIELGCGSGTVATYLNQHGFQVDYGDIHRRGLQNSYDAARRHLGVQADARRYLRLDITRQIPDTPYEGLLLFDVLEHLPEDRRVLENLRHVYPTPRTGREFLLFTVPAFPHLWSPWDDIQRHKRRYTIPTARALAEDSGFEVQRVTYFFLPLFFAATAVKAVRQVVQRVRPRPQTTDFTELTEARNHAVLNAVMQAILTPDRWWVRHGTLPLGTSVLVAASPR